MTTKNKTLFIPAKIHLADDVKSKWFVYFSYWDDAKQPSSGYVRFKIYEDRSIGLKQGNKITSYKEKLEYFTKLATHLNNKLSKGWSPFGDGYSRKHDPSYISIDQALRNILEFRQSSMAETAYKSFKSHVKGFQNWLVLQGYSYLQCKEIGRRQISEFLFSVQAKNNLSNRTINNYLIDIRSCYSVMKKLEYIHENPADEIEFLKAKSDKHEVFDMDLLKQVSDYMAENLPYLQLYCRFIWMGFRPIEIVRLRISDINLKTNTISLRASNEKTGDTKYRPILRTFRAEIENMQIHKYPNSYFLFSAKKRPDAVGTTRDYFTDKFEKVKKHFDLPSNYTMYGLRHTMAVELAKSGEPLVNIMKITGHRTLTALESYLRRYLNEPAQDVSHRFALTI